MKTIIVFIVLSFLICQLSFAQVGSTGLAFLKLGVGGRAVGMGEAYTAIAADPAATHYNPAALSLTSSPQILLMHKEWIQDTKTEFIAAKTNIRKIALGIGVNATSVNNIEIRTTPGLAQGTFSARNVAIGISASYQINPSLSVGVTGKYLHEKILIDEASGLAFDFGGLYTTPWDVRIGVAVNNLGSMNELRNEASKLPTIIRVGGAYESKIEAFDGSLIGAADIVSITGENKTHLHLGAELDYKHSFAARVGYQTGYDSKNFSAGIGVRYGMFSVDYAFVPFRNDLESTHTFSLGIDFF